MPLFMRVSRMACATAIVKMSGSISPGDLESSPFPEVKSTQDLLYRCIDSRRFREIAFDRSVLLLHLVAGRCHVGLERRRCGCFPRQTPRYRDQCQRSRLMKVWGCFKRPTSYMLRPPCRSHTACRDRRRLAAPARWRDGPHKSNIWSEIQRNREAGATLRIPN
jgi:hypothetical protein